ncbi:MAG: TIGR01440 family protein, partial [Clostridia bacterium]|nr:TIGR01440 family protein [Clostridia bacterium]
VFRGLYDCATENGIYLAVQCCEHLNRAIVVEREAAAGLDAVNVIPQPKAGGSMATHAYGVFKNPVVVEQIRADAGIDIGLTLIGMHLKQVAVPVRLENNRIGEALVVAARTRPKFIGGVRAVYDEELL